MDKGRLMLIEEFEKRKKTFQSLLELPYASKSAEASVKARVEGNQLFLLQQHDIDLHYEVFSHYCKSVMAAPNHSQELALAFGNRSAFLVHVKRYRECIEDVDKALEITMPDEFKAKLLRRKVECLRQLGLTKYLDAFEKSQHFDTLSKNEYNSQMEEVLKVTAIDLNNSGTKAAAILPKTDKPRDYIKIRYNEKYGRHLIARKDYNPGDIIFVEDLYATVVSPKFKYTNCHYCLKTAWSGIPCDHCNWAIFCSEDCQLKAWEAHHDIECLLISSMEMGSDELYIDVEFTIRLFVLALKEAGSMEKLKEEFAAVEKCNVPDAAYKGFYKNGHYNSQTLQRLLLLNGSDSNKKELQAVLQDIPKLLISLIKFTQVLKDFYPKKIDDLMKNEDAVFLGSLLAMLATMKRYSLPFAPEVLPCAGTKCSKISVLPCTPIGTCFGSLASLINHSCYPNANRIFTADRKILIYAQYPIKKNSQIFHQYCGHYTHMPLAQRQTLHKSYNFECDCKACIKNWAVMVVASPDQNETKILGPNKDFYPRYPMEVWDDYVAMSRKFVESVVNSRKIVIEDIQKICELIATMLKNSEEPADFVSILQYMLSRAYAALYGLEPLLFDKCDKIIQQKTDSYTF